MGFDNEKGSRLSQRNFGVTNRIWLIVAFFLLVITFTRYALPTTHSTPSKPQFSSANLKAKNYLNASDTEPNPFVFCPVYGPGDEIGAKYGAQALSKSRMHLGSGERIQRVLHRALAGQPVTISILGGSVSACHGAGDDPVAPNCYPSLFFQWWNSVFPNPATELTNGAMRRTNSGYFGYCSAHHIPDVTDLVIIELDSDDTPDPDMMENFETLIRSILIRPDQPAVLLLGHFSPQVHRAHGFAGPDHWHNVVAQFYDVPHISTKAVLFPTYLRDPHLIDKYYVDPVLANTAGHALIADILISYLQSQICAAWNVATGASFDNAQPVKHVAEAHGLFGGVGQRKGVPEPGAEDDGLDADGNRLKPPSVPQQVLQHQLSVSPVPPGRINTRPGGRAFEEIAPYCVSANDLINPLPPSMFYGSGWNAYHAPSEGGTLRTTSHYWYSTLPMSKLRVPLRVGAGDIGVYYLREPIKKVGEGSAVECWVDDNYGGARVIENAADIEEEMPSLVVIDHFVTRGSHYVECSLLGEEGQGVPMFKIIGIFST
ncbi:putative capsular associated protein [Lyophyllum shimeji]|uniref:Capsular associated protein n=1 Tax=Lyophyllum shimeji TaxID=47721 RepID=A0A9P3PNF8_LYOSH|nr:putative capsular associated protein [Lyophyllum shimeji]